MWFLITVGVYAAAMAAIGFVNWFEPQDRQASALRRGEMVTPLGFTVSLRIGIHDAEVDVIKEAVDQMSILMYMDHISKIIGASLQVPRRLIEP